VGAAPARLQQPWWVLIRRSIGGRRQLAGKLARAARTLRLYFEPAEIDRRLDCLERAGLVDAHPTRLQLVFGGLDMLRFVISPAARDYYEQRGISFGFHQLLRFLDDPVSLTDPTGFLSDRDTIVGHVMQVVHLNPVYDLQLLEMFDDGLADFERQVAEMVAGTHPRHGTIAAIVEEPDYHVRLLAYVRAYRRDRDAPHMVRQDQTLRGDPVFAAAERTFATLPGFLRYCTRIPQRLGPLLLRVIQQREFPIALAEPPDA
jgi:hypothetical protein